MRLLARAYPRSGTGAEIGAGIAGGGSEVSGDGASSELPSSAVTISGGTVYGIVMGGSYAKDGATAKITGNSSVNMTSGDILCKNPDDSPYDAVILGGGSVGGGAQSVVNGGSVAEINGGKIWTANGGGYVYQGGSIVTNGDTVLEVNAGEVSQAYGGGWIYSNGTSATDVINGNTYVKINGAAITADFGDGIVVGGSMAQGGAVAEIKGNVSVEISGGASVAQSIYGGGYSADGASASSVGGNVSIVVKDASIGGDIYAGGYGAGSRVSGDARVNFQGDSSKLAFAGTVYGTGANGSEIAGESVIAFGDAENAFSGEFAGKISGFKTLSVENSETNVAFANAFSVDLLQVASTSQAILAEGTVFDSLNIVFDDDFSDGDVFSFDLSDIFGDSATIVESAITSTSDFTITNSLGEMFAADYVDGNINVGAAIPEPSEVAAMLGALALALAAARRKA